MHARQQALEDIAGMCGRRTRLTAGERDILYKLVATPVIRARHPTLTAEDLRAVVDEYLASEHQDAKQQRHGWRRRIKA